ncbi:MAG: PASTA domain-containing protein [bacterium]|nr:PASTA domain-containing protein [bacterium]
MDPNKLCLNCMNTNLNEEFCPVCGFGTSQLEDNPKFLKPKTIINSRYVVGTVKDSNGEGITYIGYDTQLDIVVRIREYFPTGLCSRDSDGRVVIAEDCEFVFNEGIINFIELNKKLLALNNLKILLPIIEIIECNGTCYSISRWMPAITLREFLLRNGGTLTWEQARPLLIPFISAMKELHDASIIHCGISPDTLLVGKDGTIRIIEFCTRKARTAKSSMTAQLFLGFAAIEQYGAEGNIGTWTDVYGLAAVIYRIIVGSAPPEAAQREQEDTLSVSARVVESLPQNVLETLASALQVRAEDRIKNMEELKNGFLATTPTPQKVKNNAKSGKSKKKFDKNKKYALIAALITTVVIALIVAAVYFVFLKNSDGLSASSSQPSSVIEISSSEESSVSSEADPLVKLYSVPDVKGMTYSQVLSAKRDNGDFYTDDFAFEIELKQYSDKYAAGQVISQNPEAGKSVEKGEKIKLVISLGSYKTKVPNVAGYTEEEALIELLKAGFSYDSIHVVDKYDESELPSVAIETSPAQNEQVNTDEGITLYINSYNGPESSSQTNTTETVTSGDTSQ